MSLTSPLFFAFLATVVVAYNISASVPYRRTVLGLANVIFIGSYLTDAIQALPLFAFLLLGYVCVRVLEVWKSPRVLWLGVLGVLGCYIFLKRFSFFDDLGHLPFPYLTIGLSYILFRILHIMIDVRSGELGERIGPLAFFRYTCNFLTFVSGPIQRYQDFLATDGKAACELDAAKVYDAFARIITGYVKFVIVAATAEYGFSFLKPQLLQAAELPALKLYGVYGAAASLYTIYLYYNFSGYMDIVIGNGVLLGQELPENFDRPFSARTFLEFWQRWHMTLSQWFKFYLFNPLVMLLMSWFPAPALTAYLGVLAFFVTFLVIGVWHGSTAVFVIYGLLMGAGASINKLWQVALTGRLGKKRYRALTDGCVYMYLSRGITIAYFVVTLTCFWVSDLSEFDRLIGRLGLAGVLTAFLAIGGAFALFWFIADRVTPHLTAPAFLLSVRDSLIGQNLSLASKMIAIGAITTLLHKAPDFVYKAF
jgi:D-alanyl-lipoteichoic acid acyltransferase DltB (MBOAT superfamily)